MLYGNSHNSSMFLVLMKGFVCNVHVDSICILLQIVLNMVEK